MCGIVGALDVSRSTSQTDLRAIVEPMAHAMSHRGPDDSDVWACARAGVALGHRRLSVIDLSVAGRQPMVSTNGRYVITYNGESYNFSTLRQELLAAGHAFRGHSDSEVLLAAIVQWGLVSSLQRLVGQFALGLWDRRENVLHLARDRIGEKPLYYSRVGKWILFASELKPLQQHPAWEGKIDRAALAAYLRYCYVPTPHCIFENTRKLVPGSVVSISGEGKIGEPKPYWSLSEVVTRGNNALGER